jgi:plastocyanin
MKSRSSSKIRFLTGIGFLFAILSLISACTKQVDNMSTTVSGTGTKGGTAGPGTNEVWIQSMAFNPSVITVAAGTTIKWTNKEAITHTVTSKTDLFDSGPIGSNGTFSFTFPSAGTFDYHCTIHPSMVASVVVN